MARLVREIGTGETAIGMESGPKIQIIAVISPINVSVAKFFFFMPEILPLHINMIACANKAIITLENIIVNQKYYLG